MFALSFPVLFNTTLCQSMLCDANFLAFLCYVVLSCAMHGPPCNTLAVIGDGVRKNALRHLRKRNAYVNEMYAFHLSLSVIIFSLVSLGL